MGNKPAKRSDQEEEDSEKPTGRVHWINHATFYLSVILAILTGGTIRVYYLQLNQMIAATHAARDAAYDACVSAKIARQTLLEYQTGEADAHSAASGTIAQASVAIRGESGFLSMGTTHSITMTPLGQDQVSIEEASKNWKALDVSFTYNDIGKSALTNVRFKFTVQLLPHGEEPKLSDKSVYYDLAKASVLNPNQPSALGPNIIDKDNKFIDRKKVNMDDFNSGRTYIASFGRADYVDIFGVSHWQSFCGVFDNYPIEPNSSHSLRHEKCGAYNKQDSNLLYPLPRYTEPKTSPPAIEEIVCKAPIN